MIEWGDALVKELAARRCIIFFGAGASASCKATMGTRKQPPDWIELLNLLSSKIKNNSINQALATELIANKKYLDAAEVIESSLIHADYVDTMREIFELPRYKQSIIHEAVLRLDPKIVVTTNFDTIYDRYCTQGDAADGYNIFKHTDNHLVSHLRSPIRCVVKAHGCITNPESMVLTRSGFFAAKQKYPQFFKVIDALFLTNTILFVGYNLDDPDIKIALENVNIAATSSRTHYFVTSSGLHPALRSASEKTYNLNFLEFEKGNYKVLEDLLIELAARVDAYREENPDI